MIKTFMQKVLILLFVVLIFNISICVLANAIDLPYSNDFNKSKTDSLPEELQPIPEGGKILVKERAVGDSYIEVTDDSDDKMYGFNIELPNIEEKFTISFDFMKSSASKSVATLYIDDTTAGWPPGANMYFATKFSAFDKDQNKTTDIELANDNWIKVVKGSYLTRFTTTSNSLTEIKFAGGYGDSTAGAVEAYFDNVKVTKSDVLEVTLLDESFNSGSLPSSLVQTLNGGTASYPDNYNGKMNKSYKMDGTGATARPTISYTVPKNTNMNNGILSVSYDYFVDKPSSNGIGLDTRVYTTPDTTTTSGTEVAYIPISINSSGNSSINTYTNKSGNSVLSPVASGLPNKWNNLRYDIALNSTDGWGKIKFYVNGVYKGEFDTRYAPANTPTNQSFYNLLLQFEQGKISYIDDLKIVYKEFASVTSSVGYAKPDDAKNYDYQLYFKDGNSNTITTLQAGTITGYVTTNKNEALNVIVALYDNNNGIKDIKVLTSGNFSSGTFGDSSFAFSNVFATDKMKIFSFKDLTNILPRATKREFSSTGLSQ